MLKSILLFYLRHIKKLNSCARIVDFACKRYNNRVFLIRAENNSKLTFKELGERAKRIAFSLTKMGFHKGNVIAFSSTNCLEYFEIRAACNLAGIVFLGLPQHLAPEEVAYFLKEAKAETFFFKNLTNSEILTIASHSYIHLVNLDGKPYKEISRRYGGQKKMGTAAVSDNDISTLNLSSGTTGKIPKIVRLTAGNWAESLYNYVANSDVRPGKKIVFLSTLPLVTAGSTTFLPALLAGITYVVAEEGALAERIAEYIIKYQVNRLYVTPSRLLELLAWCKNNKQRFDSLENIIIGTERMPEARFKEAVEYFGPIISMGYGMVEALPPITLLSPKDYKRLDSAGKVVKGVEAKITEEGKIALRSKTVSKGYLNNPEENAKCFKDGWFYSNDYGSLDKDGFLSVFGRQEEILLKEPKPVFARDVEEKIYQLSFINRCAALPSGKGTCIFISLLKPVGQEQAKKEVLAKLNGNPILKQPLNILIKETLPISPLGKLDRRKLAEETGVWQK
ncbi:MAG: class I adenylate-forming enzyme family protein [Candidatus Omnitrophica bacterium]|nr:class I adenylate-forming enzyme family protein [Candidatus Omnitrophota bacterium]